MGIFDGDYTVGGKTIIGHSRALARLLPTLDFYPIINGTVRRFDYFSQRSVHWIDPQDARDPYSSYAGVNIEPFNTWKSLVDTPGYNWSRGVTPPDRDWETVPLMMG